MMRSRIICPLVKESRRFRLRADVAEADRREDGHREVERVVCEERFGEL